jgi:hypothetical protein
MSGTALVTAFLGFAVGLAVARALNRGGPKLPTGRRVQLLGGSLGPLAVVLILVTSDPPSSSRTTHAVLFGIEIAMIVGSFVSAFVGPSIIARQRHDSTSGDQ